MGKIVLNFEKHLLKSIKKEALEKGLTVNQHIENLLYYSIEKIPNRETIDAMQEVERSKNLQIIKNIDTFFRNL